MKNSHNKSEAKILRQKAEALLKKKSEAKILELIEELAYQNEEKTKRADELLIANKELAFQNEEKEKRASELISANKELAFQQDNLKKIASRVPGVVYQFLLRPDGTSSFPYASEAIRDTFRVSPDEVREDASKVFAVVHPDDLATVNASILVSAQNLTLWQHEFRVKFDDFTIRSLFGNAVPQKEADGSVLWHGFITDITEVNRLRERLKSSEEQRNSILNNVLDVVWSLSWPDLKVNFISKSVEQVFGRSVREFVENPSLWEDTVHPDDKHISDKAFKQLTKEGSAVRECRIVRPDGSIVWINDKSKIVVDHNGMPIRIDGVSRDITEHKRAEDELRIKEERYRLLAENASDVIWTMNLDGTITYISPAIEILRGLTVEEAMNQPIEKIHTPDSRVIVLDYMQRLKLAYASGLPLDSLRGELEYYRKDGSVMWAEVIVFPIPGSGSSSTTLLGVSRDITERKQAELALIESERKLNEAQHIGNFGYWEYDFVKRKLHWSDQIYAMYEYSKDSYEPDLNKALLSIHIDDQKTLENHFVNSLQNKTNFEVESRIISSKGEIKHIITRASPKFDEQGNPLSMLGTIVDITEQKKAETALMESEAKLKELNAGKDKFFSIIAHDLSSPFNAFLGFTRLLVEELDTLSIKELQKIALSMRNSASNVFRLLENLLEWSRMQQGKIIFNPESTLLMPLISDTISPVMDSANNKGIEISYEIPASLEVFADEYMLASTIRNLVSNAVKFSRKGGTVTIVAKPIPCNLVEIFVRDTGIGMSSTMVDDLFRLDVQINRKGTDGEPSAGLGLLLCKDFIEKHGGKLWVESEEGKGSVFFVTIPEKNPFS